MTPLLKDTNFIDLPVYIRGKVRDVYDLGDSLLIVVTDRISAFDVVFNEQIPDKGIVLNSISAFLVRVDPRCDCQPCDFHRS